MGAKKSKKVKKVKLTPEQKKQKQVQNKLTQDFRKFANILGFNRTISDGIEIVVDGRTGEFDDVFIFENIILLIEYTIQKPDSSHVLKKKPLFDKVTADIPAFLNVARKSYAGFHKQMNSLYDDTHYQVRILYVPLHEAAQETVNACPTACFFQGSVKKYFYSLAKTIHKSARIEFFNYQNLAWDQIGETVLTSKSSSNEYNGQLLPPTMSTFPAGYKVVSFYADPDSLMVGAYVLRRDGWRTDTSHLYQRVLIKAKISEMRKYLTSQKRVFVNNIIVTLPSDTALNEAVTKGVNLAEKEMNKAQPITVSLPIGYGKFGIIDGQHRIFCYHESSDGLEKQIAVQRKRQHLLVTGIIHPASASEKNKLEFEAKLFLEINDKQSKTSPGLRQDIETIVRPFSGLAVARRVIAILGSKGIFAGLLQAGHYDSPKKIKTSSIVSYGLRPLVKFEGDDCLFAKWKNPEKSKLRDREGKTTKGSDYEADLALLELYIDFCSNKLNEFFLSAKIEFGTSSWDVDLENPSVLLRLTSINGLIACFRRVVAADYDLSESKHKERMKNFKKINFENYKSSHWDALGEALFQEYKK
jgi:DGQHR domain-containing protein